MTRPEPAPGWYDKPRESAGKKPRAKQVDKQEDQARAQPPAREVTTSQHDRPKERDAELDAWLAQLDRSLDKQLEISPESASGSPRPGEPRVPAAPQAIMLSRGPHPATLDEGALLRACVETRGRSGGPGGQNRNKVETLVELVHTQTGIRAHAGERRSVRENKPVAVFRLRTALAVHVRCQVAGGDVRSALWKSRCAETGKHAGHLRVNPDHPDFCSLLAEALDMLWACAMDHTQAAARLACSPSQLVKFLKDCPHAFAFVNAHRAAAGLRPLR